MGVFIPAASLCLPLHTWYRLLHQLRRGFYNAQHFLYACLYLRAEFDFLVLSDELHLEHIAFIFKASFLFCFLLQVSTSVKQQYHDNIRWIREAGRHRLVSAQPPSALVSIPGPECRFWMLEWEQEWAWMKTLPVTPGDESLNLSPQQGFRVSWSSSLPSHSHLEIFKYLVFYLEWNASMIHRPPHF